MELYISKIVNQNVLNNEGVPQSPFACELHNLCLHLFANAHYIMKHKIQFSLIALGLFIFSSVNAQYYQSGSVTPGNPGGINTDSDVSFATNAPPVGSTVLVNYPYATHYTLQYTPVQTIPFTFNFNGGPVTQYKISTSGYITFAKISPSPVGPANVALPTATLPDSSICVWGLAGASNGGQVYTKVYGNAPNRQLWIVYWFAGNPTDTNSQNVWSIVLEETTNNIYLVDMWGNITNASNKVYNPIHLTLGVQVKSTLAYQVAASPNVVSHTWTPTNTDNIYYEFSPNPAAAYTPQVKMPVLEEFTQASCDPCFHAMPNLDSVLTNNKSICNPIRYHVWYPAIDFMDSVTLNPFVYARTQTFYAVAGVPDAKLDGTDVTPTGGYFNSVSSTILQDEAAIGSPLTINITSATYAPLTNTYSVTASIKAYYPLSSGLVAQGVLTVDTIHYAYDQSTEDPGNSSPFLHYFPQVAEDMMPGPNGTTLGAFALNQTQTLNLSWVKNHAWGAQPHSADGTYDSTGTHITIFVQDNTSKYVYQSASAPFTTLLGVPEISDISYLDIYPNPTNSSANIAFSLTQAENVNIDVYNMLGEKVYSIDKGNMPAGDHTVTIERGNLKTGIYFVRFATGNGVTTKKLVIE